MISVYPPLSGYDYYGPVSNAAARIESLGFGGQNSELYNIIFLKFF